MKETLPISAKDCMQRIDALNAIDGALITPEQEEELHELKACIDEIVTDCELVISGLRSVTHRGGLRAPEAGEVMSALETLRKITLWRVQRPGLRVGEQKEPTTREANVIMNRAKDVEKAKIARQEKKKKDIKANLKSIFYEIVNINGNSARVRQIPDEAFEKMLDQLAKKLISLKKSNSRAIVKTLNQDRLIRDVYNFSPHDIEKAFIPSESTRGSKRRFRETQNVQLQTLVSKLKDQLGVIEGVSFGFRKLRRDFHSYRSMDADSLWGNPDTGHGEQANEIYQEVFGSDYEFHPKVLAENSVKELQKMATMDPVTEEDFQIFQSACTKLGIIHILFYVNQLNPDYLQAVSRRLSQRLDRLIDDKNYGEGIVVFNPPKSEDGSPAPLEGDVKHCLIDRCEVDTKSKSIVSTVKKFIIQDLQNPGAIEDFVRGRIFLPESVSKNFDGEWDQERLFEEVEKVLAIILSEFGDDYDRDEVTCTIQLGKSNIHSNGDGNHRGIHITLTMKFGIPENGINPDGSFKEGAVAFEFQILGHQTKEEEKEDHRKYSTGKLKEIQKKMGVDMSFQDFIMQLVEVVNTKYDFEEDYTPNSVQSPTGNKPFKRGDNQREKLFLLRILTKRDAKGNLVNEDILRSLCEDPDKHQEVLKALRKLLNERATNDEVQGFENRTSISRNKGMIKLRKEAFHIIKNRDFDPPYAPMHKASYSRRRKWVIERTTEYRGGEGKRKVRDKKEYLYKGPLYCVQKGNQFFTTFNQVTRTGQTKEVTILTHEIRIEDGFRRFYRVHPEEKLLSEIDTNSRGHLYKTICFEDGKTFTDNTADIPRRTLYASQNPRVDDDQYQKSHDQTAISLFIKNNKNRQPKLKNGDKLILL